MNLAFLLQRAAKYNHITFFLDSKSHNIVYNGSGQEKNVFP